MYCWLLLDARRWSRAEDPLRGWFAKVLKVVWKWPLAFQALHSEQGTHTFLFAFLCKHLRGMSKAMINKTNDSCLKWLLRPATADTQQFLSMIMLSWMLQISVSEAQHFLARFGQFATPFIVMRRAIDPDNTSLW